MKIKILVALLALFYSGCGTNYPPLQTVKQVDIEKYKGNWYEIARFEHFFEKGCKNAIANYELTKDGKIKVTNTCTMTEDNKKSQANGIAYAVDSTNSKLKVSFFKPFYGDYWILHLDKDYTYALIGAPNRKYLWILSRDKVISNNIKNELLQKMSELGFDKNKLIWTIQE